ncbi:hypothetical protein PM082_006317 [Marasmius tenuissimus]|nr:hypothetical protein PM082_006317 [Marasmius tenuissimus]
MEQGKVSMLVFATPRRETSVLLVRATAGLADPSRLPSTALAYLILQLHRRHDDNISSQA